VTSLYAAERVTGRRVVLDRLDRDGAALACLLQARGADVVIADHAPSVAVPPGITLVHERDAAVARADLLLVDCWTGEEMSHVRQARERGVSIGNLADLVLAETRVPVIGVTGTAGKTTTARLIAQLLRSIGWEVEIPPTGRAENAWPSADSLASLNTGSTPDVLVVELTSTHLAYMTTSPRHAVVTTLWADHVELHGSEGRYIAAKQRILSRQQAGDTAVLPRGETRLTPRPGVHVTRFGAEDHDVTSHAASAMQRSNVAAAIACIRGSLGVTDDLTAAIGDVVWPQWRGECIGTVADRPVFHNGMAATPSKVEAFLRERADRSATLIVGGIAEFDNGRVHASPTELRLLERACAAIARVGRNVVLVGPAAAQIAPLLAAAGAGATVIGPDLHWAVGAALRDLDGVEEIAWVPMYPVDLGDRRRFGELVAGAASRAGLSWVPRDRAPA